MGVMVPSALLEAIRHNCKVCAGLAERGRLCSQHEGMVEAESVKRLIFARLDPRAIRRAVAIKRREGGEAAS